MNITKVNETSYSMKANLSKIQVEIQNHQWVAAFFRILLENSWFQSFLISNGQKRLLDLIPDHIFNPKSQQFFQSNIQIEAASFKQNYSLHSVPIIKNDFIDIKFDTIGEQDIDDDFAQKHQLDGFTFAINNQTVADFLAKMALDQNYIRFFGHQQKLIQIMKNTDQIYCILTQDNIQLNAPLRIQLQEGFFYQILTIEVVAKLNLSLSTKKDNKNLHVIPYYKDIRLKDIQIYGWGQKYNFGYFSFVKQFIQDVIQDYFNGTKDYWNQNASYWDLEGFLVTNQLGRVDYSSTQVKVIDGYILYGAKFSFAINPLGQSQISQSYNNQKEVCIHYNPNINLYYKLKDLIKQSKWKIFWDLLAAKSQQEIQSLLSSISIKTWVQFLKFLSNGPLNETN